MLFQWRLLTASAAYQASCSSAIVEVAGLQSLQKAWRKCLLAVHVLVLIGVALSGTYATIPSARQL